MEAIDTLLAVIAGAAIGALTGEWQASRRFEREIRLSKDQQSYWIEQQFWVRKADTYSKICDLLWDEMTYSADYENYLLGFAGDRKPPEEKSDWQERRLFLRKQGEIGGVFLSEEAVDVMKIFYGRYAEAIDHPDLTEIVQGVYVCSKEALEAMLEVSKRDLREPVDSVLANSQTPASA